jgi:hypothetical protein
MKSLYRKRVLIIIVFIIVSLLVILIGNFWWFDLEKNHKRIEQQKKDVIDKGVYPQK